MHDLLCTQPLFFSHRFLFVTRRLVHGYATILPTSMPTISIRCFAECIKRVNAVDQCFSMPHFALPTWWWCAVSLGRGIRTCMVRTNCLCISPYNSADLRTQDIKSAFDPVTDVRIEILAAVGLPSFLIDREKIRSAQ